MKFVDRRDAGVRLAKALARYDSEDAVVYALPRGGVVIADEAAKQLEPFGACHPAQDRTSQERRIRCLRRHGKRRARM